MPMKTRWTLLFIFLICSRLAAQTKGHVVEEIVARVNNEIITVTDLQRARNSLEDEAKQECRNCSPQQLQLLITEKGKNLLRDLIDQSLLVQHAKDLGISVEADVVKRLDQLRQQNGIATMEDLEKKINESGISFEDFKANIRNNLLTQEVIRRARPSQTHNRREQREKNSEEHTQESRRPQQVVLREIFVTTDG